MSLRRIPALLAVGLLAVLPACGGDDKGDDGALKIGVILPMTGPQATYGEESWNGLQLAQEDLAGKEGVPTSRSSSATRRA